MPGFRRIVVRGVAGVAVLFLALCINAAQVQSAWDRPVSAVAEQIAAILGPGQVHLSFRNLSTISPDEIPAIRVLLEQDLKAHGVQASGAESANAIRVTLSENLRERLWVAEIVEGNETRVAMVHVEPGPAQSDGPAASLILRRQALFTRSEPVLAALQTGDDFAVVEPEELVILAHAANGWQEQSRVAVGQRKALARDPRAVILASPGEQGFEVALAGMACSGSYPQTPPLAEWTAHCHGSEDPWTIAQPYANQPDPTIGATAGAIVIKAFYNAARDYFTGVVTPSLGVDLPPFYTAALLPRPDGAGLLIGGIDGKVQLAETSSLKAIAGTRDWGSDFAAIHSGCGGGTQIIASGSGEAASDSLRAYELPALEAIPASAPLAMDGTITALWTAPDGKSVFAVVRKPAIQGQEDTYEVDRVTTNCN